MRHLLIVLGDPVDENSLVFEGLDSEDDRIWRRHLERPDSDRLMAIRRQADRMRDCWAK